MVDLIYCAAGNPRFAQIAIDAGFRYGARMPNTIYHAPFFIDQDWRTPDRKRYMTALAKHRPHIATVLDLERHDQLGEVLSWAEEAAQFATTVVIIPKAVGIIASLPRTIGGVEVRLGYSVPTRYAGTELPLWEFGDWPVHLLGGSPNAQLHLSYYMHVCSADGNATMKAALFGIVWDGRWKQSRSIGRDFPYHTFAVSCRNIIAAWQKR